jgi:hypothetical protein
MSGTLSGRKTARADTMDLKMSASTSSLEKTIISGFSTESLVRYETRDSERADEPVVANMETIALKALHIDDDASLNPWTFRMFFLGTELSN